MLIRIATQTAVSILRATDREGRKIIKAARRAGYTVSAFANWQSAEALATCAAGYDVACNTMPARYVPADEGAAQERQAQATAQDVAQAWAELFPQ